MLFNSLDFALFFPVVFALYWSVFRRDLKKQNLFLLVASYVFYAGWDLRFLFLLAFSTVLDFYTGIRIQQARRARTRKLWLWSSISINLGFLGFFKYYNFFVDSFVRSVSFLGWHPDPWTLQIILPVGISFYTFHGLSYVIDIYKQRIKAEHDFVQYAVFVSFFPLLVAGPIERATHLLPQIKRARTFDYAKAIDGLRQVLWGLFKKVVIADGCAPYVDKIFAAPEELGASTLLVGAVLFAFQIYGDFSGYSDIALGTARLLGIELLKNFSFPYFARDIAEFWRRWHISLSSWFRDYLYIPLGGSSGGTGRVVLNTFIIFLVSGFWHGANWTFIAWGGLNALYFLPLLLLRRNRRNLGVVAEGRSLPNAKELMQMASTFLLTTLAWVFFRSESIGSAVRYLSQLVDASLFSLPTLRPTNLVLGAMLMLGVEWTARSHGHGLERFAFRWPRPLRHLFYYALIGLVLWNTASQKEFIYFQF